MLPAADPYKGVLTTAVYDAIGAVVRQLPMTPGRVKKSPEAKGVER